jgi:regulator of sigma E protease
MLEWLRTPLAIAFVFGLVVFIHELGHFLAAKAMGVYAPRFSIGFGPALWSRKWGETEYVLAAIPLGGYVRMASRDDEAMAFIEGGGEHAAPDAEAVQAGRATAPRYYDPNAMAPFGPLPVPEQRMFESKSLPARLLIMVAGVTMNVILCFVILAGLAFHYGELVTRTRVIGGVASLPAAPQLAATLAPGDTIIAVNDHRVTTWDDFLATVDSIRGDTLTLHTQRAAVSVAVGDASPVTREQIENAIQPYTAAVIDQVVPDGAAARAGLQPGDSIVAIDGKPASNWPDVVSRIARSPGRTLQIQVARGGSMQTLAVRPDSVSAPNPVTGNKEIIGQVGVYARTGGDRIPVSPGGALAAGWRGTWFFAGTVVGVVKGLFVGSVSVKALAGPIGIARVSAQAAETGFDAVLRLLAFLSVNVAVLNLLPIPILDGGQIVVNLAEAVKGRAFSTQTREYILRIGLVAIGLIFALVMYNDITSLVKSFFAR